MGTTLHNRATSPVRSRRRTGLSPHQRPGQYYSLSPVAQRRLRTLPLPFDPIATEVAPEAIDESLVPSTPDASHVAQADPATIPIHALETSAARPASPAMHAQALQAKSALVAQLSREVKRIEVAGRVQPDQFGRRSAVFSSGCSTIDSCLPCGGYESGTIIEHLQNSAGSGATTLALCAAREALASTDRFCVVVDWRRQFYPPAAAALGLDLKRIVIVRPKTLADRLWAIDQALRCPSIVAVIAEIEQLDDRAARRLQLAAESGGSLGLLVRNIHQRHQPSWAEVQWLVRPLARPIAPHSLAASPPTPHRPIQLELLRARGGQSGQSVHVQVNATNGRIEPATPAAAALARTLARVDKTPVKIKTLPA